MTAPEPRAWLPTAEAWSPDDLFDDTDTPAAATADEAGAAGLSQRLQASGLYRAPRTAQRQPLAQRHELRLDVDGRYPQNIASGQLRSGLAHRLHWVARLTSAGPGQWKGRIVYRDLSGALPAYSQLHVAVARPGPGRPLAATVTFGGAGTTPFTQEFEFVSRRFETVVFEFDSTQDAHPALAIQTHDHPNRPAGLPAETLSIATVYERAGFQVNVAPAGPAIALAGAGVDGVWSDTEMHDAMQAHWSRFADRPQWAMWVFHAALHESGTSLGGIMFDDIGPQHRQGTAVFTESFIAQAPAGDPAAAAWVARMRFWTACHEMGHAFNLAHSWQKSLGTPWWPLADEPEARSFMNYPYNVAGGQTAFFADFDFRFSDAELQFLRHAPRRFVQMGHADWFDHHGFEEANVSPEPRLKLVLRLNKDRPVLQFMEPAMVELKLTNTSTQPLVLPADLLHDSHHLTLVVRRQGQPARLWQPFASACHAPEVTVLAPGESLYAPLFVGAGRHGWLLAEPGHYTVQACVHLPDGEDLVSTALALRVTPPAGHTEETLAQDVFSQDVGRVLAFDGTRELATANEALREVVAQLPQQAVSTHARVALGMPLRRSGKRLQQQQAQLAITAVQGQPDEARALLADALLARRDSAAATLGHVEYRAYVEAFTAWLAREGEVKAAQDAVAQVCATLEKRQVKPAVVADLRGFGQALGPAPAARGQARAAGRAAGPAAAARPGRGQKPT